MGSDHVPPSASPEPTLPRWVHAADGLTVLLGLAALQAAVFGGFQMPGLSVTNPWRPLLMGAVLAGLRHFLVRTPPMHASVGRWTRTIWLADAARANRRELWPPLDLKFFRTLDFLVLSVVSISFTAVALLAVDRFDARIAVIAGLILGAAVRWFTPARFDAERASAGKPVAPILVLVLLTGLLFRTAPFPALDGGQIPGLYASMSAHLQRQGSVFVDDPLPDALPDERAREIYRAGTPQGGGTAQPGLRYSASRGDSVFELYPLHPLWMAVFADLFGDAARFHAVGFFGLLGVLGLALLAFELTGSRGAAFAAGILVATNPLHVFFSRSPASEAVALAFSSLGFYYLARALRSRRGAAPAATAVSLVALAAACVSLVFFVRTGGFPYLPAMAPLFALGVWLTLRDRRARGRRIIGFCTAVAALFGVSMLYGLGYTGVRASGAYARTLANLLGDGWPLVVAGVLALAAAALAEVARNPRRPAVRRFLAWEADPRPWIRAASLLVAVALAGSLLQAYLLGFTERHAGDPAHRELGLHGSGAGIFLHAGAVGWLLYVSPWLAAVAVGGMHRRPRRWPMTLLYLLVAVCMAVTLVLNVPVIPQHYDDARHLLSEIVPYTLVVAVAVTFLAAPGGFRRLGMAAILAALPFQSFFTARQMPVREGVRPYAVMERIARIVESDVVLLDAEGLLGEDGSRGHARLQTPLTHYFGLRVLPYHEPGQLADLVESFEGRLGGPLWLLTPIANAHPGLELYETFAYRDQTMDGAATIPVTVDEQRRRRTLFLHRQR